MIFKNEYFNGVIFIDIHKTALYIAVEKENIDIVQLLLKQPEIDINTLCIWVLYLIKFKKKR